MENEPSAHLTKLGWVIFGPTGDMNRSQDLQVHHICSVANEGLAGNFFNSTMFTNDSNSKISKLKKFRNHTQKGAVLSTNWPSER